MSIRVAIADDQAIMRSGLSAFIRADAGLNLVGEAVNGEEAVQLCELVQPDIFLMDLKMPVLDGIQAAGIIHRRWPSVQVLILSNFFEKGLAQSALDAGAAGYLIKDITAEELSAAIHKAHHESRPLTPRQLTSREASLEHIRNALDDDSLDASRLAGLLRRHLPGALPDCQIEVRIFPDKELLAFPAEGIHVLSSHGWRWMQAQSASFLSPHGSRYPWDENQVCECDLILAPVLSEAGFTIGGMAIWSGGENLESAELLPVIEGLKPPLARAMARALGVSNQVVSHNLVEQLAAAARIQLDLLPARMPNLAGWDFAARLEPALETSGDFYDVITLANNHLGLVTADVSDKGMGAALFMALASTLIRTYSKQYPTLPALSISTANERILTDSRSGMFVTVFYMVLDPTSGRLRYVNAGHNPPILISSQRGKTVDRLQPTGMALGVMGDLVWKQKVTRLLPGDLLVMYTDGVTDAQNEFGEFYGEARLLNVARRCNCSAGEALESILDDVKRFTGGMPQADDITLLVVKRSG